MKTKHGKLSELQSAFLKQVEFQKKVVDMNNLPHDNVHWFSYHIQAMVEEMGELLKSDKRWKTHRNVVFDPSNKLEEMADVFITIMNLAIFANISCDELMEAVMVKIDINEGKLKGARETI